MKFSKVQMAAYELIQSDARFLYALTDISRNARNINSNYIMMSQPYIGIFTDGAEQWCNKVGLKAPAFNESEKAYYSALRQGHKLFQKSYDDYMTLLIERLNESDKYFYNIRSLRERILGYYNVGVDICDGAFCGNTIIGAMYAPMKLFETPNIDIWLRNMSVISGKIAVTFNCTHFPVYKYDDELVITYKDFHFFKNCPLKIKTDFGFLLFSILCSINYVTIFIGKYFVEEIPQKFKFAYLQYYYLCNFMKELNMRNDTKFCINESLYNRNFRNCLAHYGLGQFL